MTTLSEHEISTTSPLTMAVSPAINVSRNLRGKVAENSKFCRFSALDKYDKIRFVSCGNASNSRSVSSRTTICVSSTTSENFRPSSSLVSSKCCMSLPGVLMITAGRPFRPESNLRSRDILTPPYRHATALLFFLLLPLPVSRPANNNDDRVLWNVNRASAWSAIWIANSRVGERTTNATDRPPCQLTSPFSTLWREGIK
mmetsp:Transcript_40238/g.97199  ORF Transcript_40238/g.97199 Transcript_40238/m.97199 type:complete len:200 (+) Transcript_40238:929-1528(+)